MVYGNIYSIYMGHYFLFIYGIPFLKKNMTTILVSIKIYQTKGILGDFVNEGREQ